jgi:hypothetical protein
VRKLLAVVALIFLAVIPAQAQSVTLNWNASAVDATNAAATSYQVWRGTVAGGETLLTSAGTGGNVGLALTFTDSSVVPGTTYFYEVFALNSFGVSLASNEVSATIPSAVPTGKPNAPVITITITLPPAT